MKQKQNRKKENMHHVILSLGKATTFPKAFFYLLLVDDLARFPYDLLLKHSPLPQSAKK